MLVFRTDFLRIQIEWNNIFPCMSGIEFVLHFRHKSDTKGFYNFLSGIRGCMSTFRLLPVSTRTTQPIELGKYQHKFQLDHCTRIDYTHLNFTHFNTNSQVFLWKFQKFRVEKCTFVKWKSVSFCWFASFWTFRQFLSCTGFDISRFCTAWFRWWNGCPEPKLWCGLVDTCWIADCPATPWSIITLATFSTIWIRAAY